MYSLDCLKFSKGHLWGCGEMAWKDGSGRAG